MIDYHDEEDIRRLIHLAIAPLEKRLKRIEADAKTNALDLQNLRTEFEQSRDSIWSTLKYFFPSR